MQDCKLIREETDDNVWTMYIGLTIIGLTIDRAATVEKSLWTSQAKGAGCS